MVKLYLYGPTPKRSHRLSHNIWEVYKSRIHPLILRPLRPLCVYLNEYIKNTIVIYRYWYDRIFENLLNSNWGNRNTDVMFIHVYNLYIVTWLFLSYNSKNIWKTVAAIPPILIHFPFLVDLWLVWRELYTGELGEV